MLEWEEVDNNVGANSAAEYERLGEGQKAKLEAFIREHLAGAKRVYRNQSSYGLKHEFAEWPGGFYVTNGAFKGAMVAAGFPPVDEARQNWFFRVKRRKPIP